MTHTKEPWLNIGLKLDSEPADMTQPSDDGIRFDNPYLYQPPIETTKEKYARKYGYRLNLKTGEYESLWVGEGKVLRPEPGPNIDIVTEDGDVSIKKENVPKRFWKKVFGLSDADEGRKG